LHFPLHFGKKWTFAEVSTWYKLAQTGTAEADAAAEAPSMKTTAAEAAAAMEATATAECLGLPGNKGEGRDQGDA
jgi:hypothetical protein